VAWLSNREGFTLQNKYSVMIQDIRLPVLAEDLASNGRGGGRERGKEGGEGEGEGGWEEEGRGGRRRQHII